MDTTTKIKGFLQLARFPNTFTAMADIMAGVLIVSGFQFNLFSLGFLLLASASIYGAGCVLNDICDRKEDSITRPSRPLPSGVVSLPQAALFCVVLFGTGVCAAAMAGKTSLLLATCLIAVVITYDCLSKSVFIFGPLTMAACRSINLLLGMSVNLTFGHAAVFPFLTLGYIYFLTWLATFETGKEQGAARWVIFCGIHFILSVFLLLTVARYFHPDGLAYLLLVLLVSGPHLWKAALKPGSETAGKCVKWLVLSIPLLDAAYVAATHNWLYGLPVVFFLVPSLIFAKIFYVT